MRNSLIMEKLPLAARGTEGKNRVLAAGLPRTSRKVCANFSNSALSGSPVENFMEKGLGGRWVRLRRQVTSPWRP